MSTFNEAMTQIRELEERAIEELKEIVQVGNWHWHIHPSTGLLLCSAPLPDVTWALLPQVFRLA